jgi:heme-degrading monooxygenase HmoA
MTPGSYAVVFVSHRTAGDPEGYEAMAERMVELARAQPGFLGMRSARGNDGVGITVCYWSSADAIAAWRGFVVFGVRSHHRSGRAPLRVRYY